MQTPADGERWSIYKGLCYALGSALTGWNPNPNKYATATRLEGAWSEFKDIAPPEKNTYNSQSSMLLKVVGSRTTTLIFIGDIRKPRTQWDSRYVEESITAIGVYIDRHNDNPKPFVWTQRHPISSKRSGAHAKCSIIVNLTAALHLGGV